jgi:hypothetical protein
VSMDSQQRGPSLRKVYAVNRRSTRLATEFDRLGAPRPTLSRVTTNDGRSPGSRVIALDRLPRERLFPSGFLVLKLAAYSCGGTRNRTHARTHRIPF